MRRAEPIESDRVTLSPLAVGDAEQMAVVLADPELYTFTGGTPPTVDELRARYRRQVVGCSPDGTQLWRNWIVRPAGTEEPVGFVQATVAGDGSSADIAWVIGSPWQGRGYATAAAAAMVDWLCRRGVERFSASIHPDNAASNAVARRLGLRPTDEFDDGERVWILSSPSAADG
jgi:RimJ/RimL family protein N-acetyltransferase